MKQVDARNTTCPKPVILTLEALSHMDGDDALEVMITDEVAKSNLERLAREKNLSFSMVDKGEYTSIYLGIDDADDLKKQNLSTDDVVCDIENSTIMKTLAVGCEFMGHGNDELGRVLMKGHLYALAHSDAKPQTIVFFNSGAKLTCKGSESIEDLKELEASGVEILTCGTCLDYLNLKDDLMVGDVTNMYAITQILLRPNVSVLS